MKEYSVRYAKKGLAEAAGNYIRRCLFNLPEKYAIVGVTLNNLQEFEAIPHSTDTVLDFKFKLTEMKFKVKKALFEAVKGNDPRVVGYPSNEKPEVIEVHINTETDYLTSDCFSEWLDLSNSIVLCNTVEKTRFAIVLYITLVDAINSDEQNRTIMFKHGVNTDKVIAINAKNHLDIIYTYDVSSFGTGEALIMKITGETLADEEAAMEYIRLGVNALTSEFKASKT